MDAIILDLGNAIKGNCLLEGYKDKIEIISYNHNVSMQVTNDISNTERTSGKPQFGEFTLTKYIDVATPELNYYCCAGKSVPEAKITIGRNAAEEDGRVMPFIVYSLTNAIVSSVSVSGGTGGKPVETLTINFTKIKWELTTQKDDGIRNGTTGTVWDLGANKYSKVDAS